MEDTTVAPNGVPQKRSLEDSEVSPAAAKKSHIEPQSVEQNLDRHVESEAVPKSELPVESPANTDPVASDARLDNKKDHKINKSKGKGGSREYKGKNKRAERKWEPRPEGDGPKEPRLPKRKVALFVGFSGSGYNGMQ